MKNPTDVHLVEAALRTAMVEHSLDIRLAYSDVERKHGHHANWRKPGYYDKTLARRYASILAPRVAELMRSAA